MRLADLSDGQVYSWNDVSDIHKVRNGIYQRKGRLISLLTDFGRINPCYPDVEDHSSETILYHGFGRHGNQRLDAANKALFNAIASAHLVPLFSKLSVGKWQFVAFVRVTSGEYVFDPNQDRMVWQFTLQKASEPIVKSAALLQNSGIRSKQILQPRRSR